MDVHCCPAYYTTGVYTRVVPRGPNLKGQRSFFLSLITWPIIGNKSQVCLQAGHVRMHPGRVALFLCEEAMLRMELPAARAPCAVTLARSGSFTASVSQGSVRACTSGRWQAYLRSPWICLPTQCHSPRYASERRRAARTAAPDWLHLNLALATVAGDE